jgi:NAD(P)-dependent dehydrogenase (short-subunit alcohol dehydrogenase family)
MRPTPEPLLRDKDAVIYGGGGAIGGSVARAFARELAPYGIRTICLRPQAIPEAAATGSHSREVFRPAAEHAGLSIEEMLQGAAGGTLLKRLPTLAELASTAAFMASERAGAMTGTVANLTWGFILDRSNRVSPRSGPLRNHHDPRLPPPER